MAKLFPNDQPNKSIDISLDPRPGVDLLPPNHIIQWLEDDVEVIDLGEVRRDDVIQPTTWHQ
jgi:hypothetical protein